jgi:hypothetical protein
MDAARVMPSHATPAPYSKISSGALIAATAFFFAAFVRPF